MEKAGKLYAFEKIMPDSTAVQESLASNVSHFLANYPRLLGDDLNLEFQWNDPEKALAGRAKTEDWTRLTFNVSFSSS
jgi:hypothetical protein